MKHCAIFELSCFVSTFVVKIATFAKRGNVRRHYKEPHIVSIICNSLGDNSQTITLYFLFVAAAEKGKQVIE